MHGSIVGTDDLCEITGYMRPADAARCLRDQGIQVFDSRRGPWTTIEIINAAAGIRPGAHNDAPLDPSGM